MGVFVDDVDVYVCFIVYVCGCVFACVYARAHERNEVSSKDKDGAQRYKFLTRGLNKFCLPFHVGNSNLTFLEVSRKILPLRRLGFKSRNVSQKKKKKQKNKERIGDKASNIVSYDVGVM